MRLSKSIQIAFILPFFVFLASCSGGGGGSQRLVGDGSFDVGGQGANGRDVNGSVNAPESLVDCSRDIREITIDPSRVDFEINEVHAPRRECISVTLNTCLPFTVSISSSSSKDPPTEGAAPAPEFVLFANGVESNKLDIPDGGKSFEVCYQRYAVTPDAEHPHTGRANIVVDGKAAFVVPITGQTLPAIFTITSPADDPDGQLVWEQPNGELTISPCDVNQCDDPFLSYFSVPVNAQVDTQYASIFKNNEVAISVQGGITKKFNFGADGKLHSSEDASDTIKIPGDPRIYPVSFNIETKRQGILTHTLDVIRFTRPDVALIVKDSNKNDVNIVGSVDAEGAVVTDSPQMFVVIPVKNLDVSGPTEDAPVYLSVDRLGKPRVEPKKLLEERTLWKGHGNCLAMGIEGQDDAYCFTIDIKANDPNPSLVQGLNTLKVTACNDYTDWDDHNCSIHTVNVVVNSMQPDIIITKPTDGQVYALNDEVVIEGIVRNFKPNTDSECFVKLLVNGSTTKDADLIDICPEGTNVSTNNRRGNRGNVIEAKFNVVLRDPKKTNQEGTNETKSIIRKPQVKSDGTLEMNGSAIVKEVVPSINTLTTYTNLIQIKAEDVSGHVTYKTVSFQRGNTHEAPLARERGDGTRGDLPAHTLGGISQNGTVENAPIMLNVAETTLNDPKLIKAVENAIADNLKAQDVKDVLTGGALKEDAAGNKYVRANSHGTAMEKVRALIELNMNGPNTDNAIYFEPSDLKDECGNVQTAAIIFYDSMQYIWKGLLDPNKITGEHSPSNCDPYERFDCPIPEWPFDLRGAGHNLNFDDVTVGKVKINSLTLKEQDSAGKKGNFIDLSADIVGNGDGPALWGHAVAYNLATGGSSAQRENELDRTNLEDPVIPLIFNVGKLSINLKDVVEIKKIQLVRKDNKFVEPMCYNGQVVAASRSDAKPCDMVCTDTHCSNKLIFHKEKISISGRDPSLKLTAFHNCASYYRTKFGNDVELPFGCSDRGEVEPLLIERNTAYGQDLWAASQNGTSHALLELTQEVLLKTFRGVLSCAPKEKINPIIDDQVFPYPSYVKEEDKFDKDKLSFAVNDKGDGLEFVQLTDATNKVFTIKPDIKIADIKIKDGGLGLKLPYTLTAHNIALPSANAPKLAKGHIYRSPSQANFETSWPLNRAEEDPYLSASLNIEEMLHSAIYLLWQKGPLSLVDLLDIDELKGSVTDDNLGVGIDKVVLGRFGICKYVSAGSTKLDTGLSPKAILFNGIGSLFKDDAMHLDITLDQNQPPTLLIAEDPTDRDARILQLGLSNVRLGVRDLLTSGENKYIIGAQQIVEVRLDALLKLKAKYNKATRTLDLSLLPLPETPLYLSVTKRGPSYNDENVLSGIKKFALETLFPLLSFGEHPTLRVMLPGSLRGFDQVQTCTGDLGDSSGQLLIQNLTTLGSNGECGEGEKPQYRFANGYRPTHNNSSSQTTGLIANWYETTRRKHMFDLKENMRDARAQVSLIPQENADNYDEEVPVPVPEPVEPTVEDPIAKYCEMSTSDSIKDLLEDPLKIEDIIFTRGTPDLLMDDQNGYFHLDMGLIIQLIGAGGGS